MMSLCTLTPCTGYVPLPTTKIDFSSDLEKADPNQKKKKKKKVCVFHGLSIYYEMGVANCVGFPKLTGTLTV